MYETTSMEEALSINFNRRYLVKEDLLREWQCVCGVKVVDRPTAFTQILTCLDASLDITVGFIYSLCHAHTGREVARNGS